MSKPHIRQIKCSLRTLRHSLFCTLKSHFARSLFQITNGKTKLHQCRLLCCTCGNPYRWEKEMQRIMPKGQNRYHISFKYVLLYIGRGYQKVYDVLTKKDGRYAQIKYMRNGRYQKKTRPTIAH